MRAWNDVIVREDTAFVGALLSDEFSHIAHNGYQARRAELLCVVADAGTTLEPMLAHDVTVRASANTVVATGWFRQARISGGEMFETFMRYTDVHVRDGRRWRAVSAVSAASAHDRGW